MVSNTVCVYKLLKSRMGAERATDTNRRATVTVLILSTLFVTFNLLSLVVMAVGGPRGGAVPGILMDFAVRVGIPMNSCLNPVVYLCRKEGMRVHVRGLWRRLLETRWWCPGAGCCETARSERGNAIHSLPDNSAPMEAKVVESTV